MSVKAAVSALLVVGTSGAASAGCYVYNKQHSSVGSASSAVDGSEKSSDSISEPQTKEVPMADAPEAPTRQEKEEQPITLEDAGEGAYDPYAPTEGSGGTEDLPAQELDSEDLSGGGEEDVEESPGAGEALQVNGEETVDSDSGTATETIQPSEENEPSGDLEPVETQDQEESAEDNKPKSSGYKLLNPLSWFSSK